MTRTGFEPVLPKETVLETVALNHSANESMEPPAGLEPAIYRLEVCRLIWRSNLSSVHVRVRTFMFEFGPSNLSSGLHV